MNDVIILSKEQYDELMKKIDNLQKENKELKKKVNSSNSLKNFYKKEYESFKNDFDKIVDEKVEKNINKKIEEINHKHMLEIMSLKQTIFNLNNKLNINSETSNIPASKNPIGTNISKNEIKITPICNSRKQSTKSIGAQPNHKKNKLEQFDVNEIDEFIEHTCENCLYCNSKNLQFHAVKVRDEIDIVVKTVKRRHKFYEYKCLDCGKVVKTPIPLNLHADNQYGTNIKTLVLMLTHIGYISVNRTKSLISSITDNQVNMSEGYISGLSKKIVNNTKDFIKEIRNKIFSSKVNYWDDTVIPIGNNRYGCFRTYINDLCVLYKAHDSKSKKTIEEDDILTNLSSDSYLMHDHMKHNYNKKYNHHNLECNQHIIRGLKGLYQNTNHKWALDMKNLLENTYEKRNENIRNNILNFSKAEIEEFDTKYDELICLGKQEYEELSKTTIYKKEINQLKFMEEYKKEITAWVRNYELPYSNNKSESSFRFIKSKIKISGLFQNVKTASNYADIMSYIETCKIYKVNKFEAMKKLVDNNLYTFEELEKLRPAT